MSELKFHLSEVIGETTSKSQSAIITGRWIFDTALVANKVVDDARANKRPSLVIKLDFDKAYDRVGIFG